jgi:hypothetical protein
VYFDAIETPSYRSAEPRRIVFLDNLEVDEQVGVEHRIEQWKKDRRRVFGYGVNGSDEHVCFCKVLPVPGGYEMRYAALETLYTNSMRGRAFSRDGLHWERREPVDESAMTLDGKHWPSWFCRVIFLEDPQEKNPNRRFKGLYPNWRDIAGLQVRTWDVVASADAIHWETVPEVQPVVLGDYSTNYHLYRDEEDRDPRRRYKAVMVIACNAGRNPVIYTSPDLIHWDGVYKMREEPERMDSPLSPWETGPIVIDPDAAENPWEEEVHDALIWREHGLLMYHYDAFYFGANQHVNKALALSRDGRHYWRVRRGAINMPHGNCGEWDNGRVRTSPPIRVGDELWIHFVGMPAGNFGDPDRDDPTNTVTRAPSPDDHKKFKEIRPWSVGLARLRVDGWASFRLHPDRETGHVTTVPFEYTGGALVVNGSGLGAGGIRVEVRRADNRAAVPGYEGAKSEFSSPDAVSSKVTWKGAKPFASGKYRLRFIFDHVRARLFAFGFE